MRNYVTKHTVTERDAEALRAALAEGLIRYEPGPNGVHQYLPTAKLQDRDPTLCLHHDYRCPSTLTDSQKRKFIQRVCRCGFQWYVEIK